MPVADCVDRIFAVSHVRYESSAGPHRPKRTRCQKKMPPADVMYRPKLGPRPGCHVSIATTTAAVTTTVLITIDAMCILTIDCRCETCIDGITRYQCPRIIAVDAPPRSAVELRKLATVSTLTSMVPPVVAAIACDTSVIRPPPQANPTSAGRIDASVRPTVSQ